MRKKEELLSECVGQIVNREQCTLEVSIDIRDVLVDISTHLRNANDIANRLIEDKE